MTTIRRRDRPQWLLKAKLRSGQKRWHLNQVNPGIPLQRWRRPSGSTCPICLTFTRAMNSRSCPNLRSNENRRGQNRAMLPYRERLVPDFHTLPMTTLPRLLTRPKSIVQPFSSVIQSLTYRRESPLTPMVCTAMSLAFTSQPISSRGCFAMDSCPTSCLCGSQLLPTVTWYPQTVRQPLAAAAKLIHTLNLRGIACGS